MKPGSVQLAGALVFPALMLHTAAADLHVWTLTETRHVLRSETPGTNLAVQVSAARNEWVSFQVLLRSESPAEVVRLEPADLLGPGGMSLPRSSARLYRQYQLQLETGTYRNENFKPDWYPDPLIPFEHPLPGRKLTEARFRAVPFALPANETHAFWVDLHVLTNVVPGEYQGTYRLTLASQKQVSIPLTLTVWNFALPQTPTLATAFGSPAQQLRSYYRQPATEGRAEAPADWSQVEQQCAQLLADHCINATPPPETLRPRALDDGSFSIPTSQVDALRNFIDRYHVNAIQTPHPSSVVKDPDSERDKLRTWLAAFDKAAAQLDRPHVVFYTYLKDEPNTLEDYRYVQKWGRAVRECKSMIKVLVVEQTWVEPGKGGADSAWGDLYGAVDIWCPLFSLHRQDSAAKRQALGETIWTYTALCQGPPTPWWHIDFPLLNYRVPAWMAWRDGMKGLLYWGGMSYWRQVQDPWEQAPFYTGNGKPQQGAKGIVFNGEGSLIYPARAVGYDGIAPTIRLKVLRDAVEDYEYLELARRAGRSSQADSLVKSLAPSWFQWDRDPAAYETARAKLAGLILAAKPAGP